MVMLLAALPLRGYAGVLTALCESHHGGAAVAEEHMHKHGASHHPDSDQGAGGPSHAASVCSVCASCCAGAVLAPVTDYGIAVQTPAAFRIPYFDCQVSGFVPEHLDRPPLAL
jgi:hypothetical protein